MALRVSRNGESTWKVFISRGQILEPVPLISDVICMGDYEWTVLLCSGGFGNKYISIYLVTEDFQNLPDDWCIRVKFSFTMMNEDPSVSVKMDFHHAFSVAERLSGSDKLVSIEDIVDPSRGFLNTDSNAVLEIIFRDVKAGPKGHATESVPGDRYILIKVVTDADFANQVGRDMQFGLVNFDLIKNFRVQKKKLLTQFQEEVNEQFGIPDVGHRLWLCQERQNHTYRPWRLLEDHEKSQTVGSFQSTLHEELKLYFEMRDEPFLSPERREDCVLAFFKLYCPKKE